MRSTLACTWCRKAKVKCRHDGHPPCRSCSLRSSRECVLSYPPKPIRQRPVSVSDRERPLSRGQLDRNSDDFLPHDEVESQREAGTISNDWTDVRPVACPLATIEFALRKAACHSFVQSFPEFGFIHQPTFFDDLERDLIDPVKLAAIVALCSGNKEFSQHADIVKQCADFACNHIMAKVVDRPDMNTVQTLVILSLYEWGNGRGFQSWMYLGMAIRMGEALISDSAISNGAQNFMTRELAYRTLWACFIMDCILSGGKGRKESFKSETVAFPLPRSDDDFTFQTRPVEGDRFLCRSAYRLSPALNAGIALGDLGSQHYLCIIIQGFDIWSSVTNWIKEGGRRKEPNNEAACPWNEDSRWSKFMSALNRWRGGLPPHLLYSRSNNNMRAFALRNQGSSFAMVNLLYYITIIFLHREYTPFLPHRVGKPQGPIDPPLLPNTHPSGWWEDSAQSLFDAAISIVDIVQDLEANEIQLRTPLMCFWMYTAAFALQYGHSWPHMVLRSTDMLSKYEWAMSWLQEVNKVWKICSGWIKTIDSIQLVYDGIKEDVYRYITVGRDSFVELEDNVQRLAEVETSSSTPGEPARILIALSQSGSVRKIQSNSHMLCGRIDEALLDSDCIEGNPHSLGTTRIDFGCLGVQDSAYNHHTAENRDEVIRALFDNQDSISALTLEPMPDNTFNCFYV